MPEMFFYYFCLMKMVRLVEIDLTTFGLFLPDENGQACRN